MESAEVEVVDTPVEAPALSITEHAAQFSDKGLQAEAELAAKETPEETAARHHSADQKREKETGKFDSGKVRHRANSQRASAEDVPRIQQLTARAKGAEERAAAAERELATLKAQHASPAKIAQAEAKVKTEQTAASAEDPAPTEDDPKFGGDYTKYLDARAEWVARKAYRDERQREYRAAEDRQLATRKAEEDAAFETRMSAALAKYPDYFSKADRVFAKLPANSQIESYIYQHDLGEDVVAYLDSHAEELDELLALTRPIQQIERLALLTQRLSSSSGELAGTNGSVATRKKVELPPKPVNPLRTEAPRATELPPTDGSLSILKHAKAFKPRT